MFYRTKTYIAADWDHDRDAVDQLYHWKNGRKWALDFSDAHELTQSRDSSLACTIKASLKKRMDVSKKFVLIVGNHTDLVTKGSCQFCNFHYLNYCLKERSVDKRSFIKYECDKAVEAVIKIIVLYNSATVNKSKCPASVRHAATHVAMKYRGIDGKNHWDYEAVRKALEV